MKYPRVWLHKETAELWLQYNKKASFTQDCTNEARCHAGPAIFHFHAILLWPGYKTLFIDLGEL